LAATQITGKRSLQHVDPALAESARIVAEELGETTLAVRRRINRAIQVAGMAVVMETVAQAKKVQGTMLVNTGSRPRTLGGCFFTLLKTRLASTFDLIQKPQTLKSINKDSPT